MAAAIAADKALHQFISGNIQFIAGNIFDTDGRLLFIGSRGRINPGTWHGVLTYVIHQVIHHPAEHLAIGQHHGIACGRVDDHRQLRLLQPLLIFALQLGKQHIHIGGLAVHWDHAAGSLAGFHQILSQFF